MAPKKLTEYERKRLENIKRNDEVLASLKIHSTLTQLSSQTKLHSVQTKSYKVSPNKKIKTETPVVIRRSLRTRGMPPDLATAAGLNDDLDETPKIQTTPTKSPLEKGPLSMRDAYTGKCSYGKLEQTIMNASKKPQFSDRKSSIEGIDGEIITRVSGSIDLESLKLEPENVARVVPGRIMTIRIFPSADMRMIVVGNKSGDVGFWNVDSEKEDGDGIYMYHSHPGPVSGIAIQPFSMSKMFTCCYDGFIRLMDVEKETFDLVYSSDDSIYSLSQRPNDSSLYFGEGQGGLSIWDERARKCSSSWSLHEDRINTIDFNPGNTNLMVTSSNDRTVCIWDLRNIGKSKPQSLKMVSHGRAVQSAYFSPSGSLLGTTSFDDKVTVLRGANYDEMSMISHYNQTGRWISPFRGIWGWDDSYIYIGNMKRGVDVISTAESKIVGTFMSENMSAIPCRFDVHPHQVGTFAAATGGGQVYLWTSC